MTQKIDLGVLRTVTIEDHSQPQVSGGVFELPVQCDEATFFADPDKFGYCKHIIATHLAHAVRETTVPTSAWQFVSNDFMIKNYQLPAVMSFDRG